MTTPHPHAIDNDAVSEISERMCAAIRGAGDTFDGRDILAATFALVIAQAVMLRHTLGTDERLLFRAVLTDYVDALTIVRDTPLEQLVVDALGLVRES